MSAVSRMMPSASLRPTLAALFVGIGVFEVGDQSSSIDRVPRQMVNTQGIKSMPKVPSMLRTGRFQVSQA